MKKHLLYFIFISLFSFTGTLTAKQEKYIKHTVAKGETITNIAQKYKVTPYEIFKLNPDSQNGIQLNSVLLIPQSTYIASSTSQKKEEPIKTTATGSTHLVQAKETLYSISRLYNINVETLKAANPEAVKSGLKTGQTIVIPTTSNETKVVAKPKSTPEPVTKVLKTEPKTVAPTSDESTYTIAPKDTKYSVSKKFGITIQELEQLNPSISSSFPVGTKLIIKSKGVQKTISKETKTVSNDDKWKQYLQDYTIKKGETISAIAIQLDSSVKELLFLNPDLEKGSKEGMVIRVPKVSKKPIEKKEEGLNINTKKGNSKKHLAILLPFNINKLSLDSLNSTQAKLKKDKFLNLTLDFYSGVLMAIDSAKVLGMNVDIDIYDSEETKNSSNVSTLVNQHNLKSMDAIIGPFYQTNVEKLAELLEPSKTPVISPLSKDVGKKYKNLFQSMPSNEQMKNAMFDYMKSKDGNIVAVIDPKKNGFKQYLKESQKGVKLIGLGEKNNVVSDSIKNRLQKNKTNFVILGSESTNIIIATTTALVNLQKEYPIQLVIVEANETLDFEEIDLNKLTKLNLLYASVTKPNDSNEANQFDAKYKKTNKILPNQYAIRGFDLTFDTLMRLSQNNSFEDTILSNSSEQIENKFDYIQNSSQGYSNKGVYILQYTIDLNIKQAL